MRSRATSQMFLRRGQYLEASTGSKYLVILITGLVGQATPTPDLILYPRPTNLMF